MNVSDFINGGKFPSCQHVIVMARQKNGLVPMGGGTPESMVKRFGDEEIKYSFVYESMLKIEI